MMRIPKTRKESSEKGQTTIGMLIFFPVLMVMVLTILYTGFPIYLKLSAQNAAYAYAMETARAPGYNTAAMDFVGDAVVNRTPGLTTWARQTLMAPYPVDAGGASDDPGGEFFLRSGMNGQVTIIPNGDKNPVLNMNTLDPNLPAMWNSLITGSAFGPRPTFMRCDDLTTCWSTKGGGNQGWALVTN